MLYTSSLNAIPHYRTWRRLRFGSFDDQKDPQENIGEQSSQREMLLLLLLLRNYRLRRG